MVSGWLTLSVSIIGVLLIPCLALLWRVAFTISHDRTEVGELIKQVNHNQESMDRRVRWLEENLWNGRRDRRGNGT